MATEVFSDQGTQDLSSIETGLPDHEWDTPESTAEIEPQAHWKYLRDLGEKAAHDVIPPVVEWGYGRSQRTSGISDRVN